MLLSVLKTCNKNYFNIETMLSVFDTYVDSILSYGSEVWVFHHIQFCKRLPGVWKGTCNDFIFSELERFPLQIIIKLRIFKY